MNKTVYKEICVFDFKHDSILVVLLEPHDQNPRIKHCLSVPNNLPVNLPNPPDLFKVFLDRLDKKHLPPSVITWEEGMNFRQMTLPEMPSDDFERALWLEMQNKYAVDKETHLAGYECVAENDLGEGKKEKVISIFYCEKKMSMEKITLVQNLGFEVVHVLPGQTGSAQWIGTEASNQDKDTMVCDIGYFSARFLVVRKRKILLSRVVPLGGKSLTDMLTSPFLYDGQKIQYTPEEAELLKIREGVLNPQAAHIGLARPYLEKIVAELKRSADFYEGQKFSRPISKVIFTGGGSDLKGLRGFMEQFLGMEVSFLEEENHLSSEIVPEIKEKVLSGFGGFHSALGAGFLDPSSMDLLPNEVKYEKQENRKRMSIRMAFSIALIALAFLTAWTFLGMKVAQSNLVAIESEWKETSRMNDLIANAVAQQRFKASALKGNLMLAGLLKSISHEIPSNIVLDELEFNRQSGTLMIRGVAATGKEGDVKAIAQFMSALLQTPFFSDASLVSSAQETAGVDASKFEIKCLTKGTS